jgi:hypothetical protein
VALTSSQPTFSPTARSQRPNQRICRDRKKKNGGERHAFNHRSIFAWTKSSSCNWGYAATTRSISCICPGERSS